MSPPLFYVLARRVHQELKAVELLLQNGQLKNFRLTVQAVHVVDLELLKVTDHAPPGILVMGQISSILSSDCL